MGSSETDRRWRRYVEKDGLGEVTSRTIRKEDTMESKDSGDNIENGSSEGTVLGKKIDRDH